MVGTKQPLARMGKEEEAADCVQSTWRIHASRYTHTHTQCAYTSACVFVCLPLVLCFFVSVSSLQTGPQFLVSILSRYTAAVLVDQSHTDTYIISFYLALSLSRKRMDSMLKLLYISPFESGEFDERVQGLPESR